MKRTNITIFLAIFLVIIAASARIWNAHLHIPNIAPLAAIGLFSGAVLKDKRALAFMVPLLGQFIADLYFQLFTTIPGFYGLTSQLFNYGAIVAATALGASMKQIKPSTALAYTFGASTLFFLVSNFGYFAQGWNGYSVSALIKTYADGVPFYKYTFAGDLVAGILLFGSYFMAENRFMKKLDKAKI